MLICFDDQIGGVTLTISVNNMLLMGLTKTTVLFRTKIWRTVLEKNSLIADCFTSYPFSTTPIHFQWAKWMQKEKWIHINCSQKKKTFFCLRMKIILIECDNRLLNRVSSLISFMREILWRGNRRWKGMCCSMLNNWSCKNAQVEILIAEAKS